MIDYFFRLGAIVCLLCFPHWLSAQSDRTDLAGEQGVAFIQNYPPKAYRAHSQNWEIIQDARGLMYVANGNGVLEYDGANWRTIPLENLGAASSIAINDENRIFVGGYGELGSLVPDQNGSLQYFSFLDAIPEQYRDFIGIWDIFPTTHGLYFCASKYIFRWKAGDPDNPKVWTTSTRFQAFCVNDEVYVNQTDLGWGKIAGDALDLYQGAAQWKTNSMRLCLPLASDDSDSPTLLIGGKESKLMVFDGESVSPFQATREVETYLQTHTLSNGIRMENGQYVLATDRAAAFVMNQEGRWEQSLSKKTGLANEWIHTMYEDRDHGLWLATDHGISKVEISSPIASYPPSMGYSGSIASIQRHQGALYVGTNRGVYRLLQSSNSSQPPQFQEVQGIDAGWSLLSNGQQLLAGGNEGIFLIQGSQAVPITREVLLPYAMSSSIFSPNPIYVGLSEGLGVLAFTNGRYEFLGYIDGIPRNVRSIVEYSPGELWLGTDFDGVIKLSFPPSWLQTINEVGKLEGNKLDVPVDIQAFGPEQGVPEGLVHVSLINNRVMLSSEEGLKRLDVASQSFVAESNLGQTLAEPQCFVYRMIEGSNDNIYSIIQTDVQDPNGRMEIGTSLPTEEGYQFQASLFNRLPANFVAGLQWMCPDPDHPDLLWLGGNEGLVRFDVSWKKPDSSAFSTFIRAVQINQDSVVYEGSSRTNTPIIGMVRGQFSPVLRVAPVSYNLPEGVSFLSNQLQNIRFEYAAPAYEDESETQYQLLLQGLDEQWSDWTEQSTKDYTNLPPGDYQFKVRARNVYANISEEAAFGFRVLAPWYQRWWAFVLFGLLALAVILLLGYGYSQWRTQQLEQRNAALEQTVAERTEEIQEKNVQLEQTLDHLQTTQQQLIMQEKMASLGQMSAGIAHEIKNPLNFVNNFSETSIDMLDELKEELSQVECLQSGNAFSLMELIQEIRENASSILEQGEKADEIVKNMMDHSRTQPGERRQTHLSELIEEHTKLAIHSYRSGEQTVDIQFLTETKAEIPPVLIHPQEIGRVLLNLINNACDSVTQKALSLNGDEAFQPTVQVSTELKGKEVEIRVRDNGQGIPSDLQEQIFQPFYTTKPTGQGNTGLGLSISYEIVTQGHQGSLSVESTEGEFAEFVIRFPLVHSD